MSNTVDKLKKEYQQYPDGVHVCVANSAGDWVADCGPKGDKSSEAYAKLFAAAPALKKENEELKERNRILVEALQNIQQIENGAFGLKAFDVVRLKTMISEALQSNQ